METEGLDDAGGGGKADEGGGAALEVGIPRWAEQDW